MKRLIVVTMLVTIAISTTGCRRGLRLWGLRGARCGAPATPSFSPVPGFGGGAPAPTCPGSCPTVAPSYDPCPIVPYGANLGSTGGGFGGIVDGGIINGGIVNGGVVNGGVVNGSAIEGGIVPSPSPIMQGSGAAFEVPSINGSLPSPYDNSINTLPGNALPGGLPGGYPGIGMTGMGTGGGFGVNGHPPLNKPIFSHIIGDRKLQAGETLKGEFELPVESAAKSTADKK